MKCFFVVSLWRSGDCPARSLLSLLIFVNNLTENIYNTNHESKQLSHRSSYWILTAFDVHDTVEFYTDFCCSVLKQFEKKRSSLCGKDSPETKLTAI